MSTAVASRRLRRSDTLRRLVRTHSLAPHHVVAPLLVTDDDSRAESSRTLPGMARVRLHDAPAVARRLRDAGVGGILLFGVPAARRADGAGAWDHDGVVPRTIRAIRDSGNASVIIADVCLCPYTEDGACGIAEGADVSDEATRPLIARASVAYARAGATLVAPSGMIDGGVAAIRQALDEDAHGHVGILAYAVKHASSLYGPFRDVARSSPRTGSRQTLQLDPANQRDALREAAADVAEGADVLMVKPALTNLDTLVHLRARFPDVPLAAYHVSGEYAQVRAAAARGWLVERDAILEQLIAVRRAGADLIVTYAAEEVTRWIA